MEGFPVTSSASRAAAADLFLGNLMGRLPSTNYTLPQLRRSILPFYSILRDVYVLTAIGENRLLRLFSRVRLSKLPKGEFIAFTRLIRLNGNDSAVLFHFPLDTWRPLIINFNLDSKVPLPEWSGALTHLRGKLIESPEDLIDFPPADIRVFTEDFRFPDRALCLWQAIRTRADKDSRSAINVRLAYQPSLLAQSIRGGDIADSAFSKAHDRNISNLGMGEDFVDLGPAAKIRALARCEQPMEAIKTLPIRELQ